MTDHKTSQPPAPEQASVDVLARERASFNAFLLEQHERHKDQHNHFHVARNEWARRSQASQSATPTAEPAGEAVDIAKAFHDEYERLAPSFGYETRADTKQFDPASPNGRLMIAVVGSVQAGMLQQLHIANTRIKALQGLAAKVEEQEEYILRLEASQRQLQSASSAAPEAAKRLNLNITKEWLESKLADGDDSDVSAGRPCDAPPGCNSHNCLGCDDFKAAKPEPLQKLTRITEEMGLYPWQQAQAGEPEVTELDCGCKHCGMSLSKIAKKDAALKACVRALKSAKSAIKGREHTGFIDAAITQAEEAL